MNKYYITGALTRDPETGVTESGVGWSRFTVAARKRYHKEGEADAEFVQVTAWRGLGDSCGKYLKKGRKVAVVGEPKVHVWTGQDGKPRGQIEMNADEVEFLSSGEGRRAPTDEDAPPERGRGAAAESERMDAQSGMTVVDPEDMPY